MPLRKHLSLIAKEEVLRIDWIRKASCT